MNVLRRKKYYPVCFGLKAGFIVYFRITVFCNRNSRPKRILREKKKITFVTTQSGDRIVLPIIVVVIIPDRRRRVLTCPKRALICRSSGRSPKSDSADFSQKKTVRTARYGHTKNSLVMDRKRISSRDAPSWRTLRMVYSPIGRTVAMFAKRIKYVILITTPFVHP